MPDHDRSQLRLPPAPAQHQVFEPPEGAELDDDSAEWGAFKAVLALNVEQPYTSVRAQRDVKLPPRKELVTQNRAHPERRPLYKALFLQVRRTVALAVLASYESLRAQREAARVINLWHTAGEPLAQWNAVAVPWCGIALLLLSLLLPVRPDFPHAFVPSSVSLSTPYGRFLSWLAVCIPLWAAAGYILLLCLRYVWIRPAIAWQALFTLYVHRRLPRADPQMTLRESVTRQRKVIFALSVAVWGLWICSVVWAVIAVPFCASEYPLSGSHANTAFESDSESLVTAKHLLLPLILTTASVAAWCLALLVHYGSCHCRGCCGPRDPAPLRVLPEFLRLAGTPYDPPTVIHILLVLFFICVLALSLALQLLLILLHLTHTLHNWFVTLIPLWVYAAPIGVTAVVADIYLLVHYCCSSFHQQSGGKPALAVSLTCLVLACLLIAAKLDQLLAEEQDGGWLLVFLPVWSGIAAWGIHVLA